jgi:DEAD/DEAH box helicase domain-containing protein
VRDGKNVVVVTPTASGKTLCFNLPVLNAVLENPDTRALHLFPTKALAQDQLAELQDLAKRLDDSFGVFTYDGDTQSDARKAIRERGHIVLTNPDMLHTGTFRTTQSGYGSSRTCATSSSTNCTRTVGCSAAILPMSSGD